MKKITLLFAALVAFITANVQGQVFPSCTGGFSYVNSFGEIEFIASDWGTPTAIAPQTITSFVFVANGQTNLPYNCNPTGSSSTISLDLIARGSLGDSAVCSVQVQIRDTFPPTAICKNITVALNSGTQNVTVQGIDIDNNSTDNCVLTYLIDGSASKVYTSANLGTNNATLTIQDIFSNTATCSSVVTVVAATSINETAALHNISIAPNPFSNDLRLDFSASEALSENTIVSVFGLDGKRIATREIAAGTSIYALQMPELAAGVYILQLQNSKFRISEKIMKF